MKSDYHTRFKQARLYAAQVRARKAMGDRYEHARPWSGPSGLKKLTDRKFRSTIR